MLSYPCVTCFSVPCRDAQAHALDRETETSDPGQGDPGHQTGDLDLGTAITGPETDDPGREIGGHVVSALSYFPSIPLVLYVPFAPFLKF
jgi:hypothetical protein